MTKLELEEATCPICLKKYSYIKGGYKSPTCNKFECLYIYLHRTPLKAKGVIEAKKKG